KGEAPAQFPFAIGGRSASDMWLIYGTALDHWDGAKWTLLESMPLNGNPNFNSVWESETGDVFVTASNGDVHHYLPNGSLKLLSACNCFAGSVWGTASDDLFITTLPPGIVHYDGKAFSQSYAGPSIAGSYQGVRDDVWVSGGDGSILHYDGKG